MSRPRLALRVRTGAIGHRLARALVPDPALVRLDPRAAGERLVAPAHAVPALLTASTEAGDWQLLGLAEPVWVPAAAVEQVGPELALVREAATCLGSAAIDVLEPVPLDSQQRFLALRSAADHTVVRALAADATPVGPAFAVARVDIAEVVVLDGEPERLAGAPDLDLAQLDAFLARLLGLVRGPEPVLTAREQLDRRPWWPRPRRGTAESPAPREHVPSNMSRETVHAPTSPAAKPREFPPLAQPAPREPTPAPAPDVASAPAAITPPLMPPLATTAPRREPPPSVAAATGDRPPRVDPPPPPLDPPHAPPPTLSRRDGPAPLPLDVRPAPAAASTGPEGHVPKDTTLHGQPLPPPRSTPAVFVSPADLAPSPLAPRTGTPESDEPATSPAPPSHVQRDMSALLSPDPPHHPHAPVPSPHRPDLAPHLAHHPAPAGPPARPLAPPPTASRSTVDSRPSMAPHGLAPAAPLPPSPAPVAPPVAIDSRPAVPLADPTLPASPPRPLLRLAPDPWHAEPPTPDHDVASLSSPAPLHRLLAATRPPSRPATILPPRDRTIGELEVDLRSELGRLDVRRDRPIAGAARESRDSLELGALLRQLPGHLRPGGLL